MNTQQFDFQGRVTQFMEASGQSVRTVPTDMSLGLAELRYNLYLEEVKELRDAIEQGDKIEQLDAITDILYILLGTANTVGTNLNSTVIDAITLCDRKKGRSTFDVLTYLEGLSVYDIKEALEMTITLAYDLGFKGSQIEKAFYRVHNNNMSKFCETENEANRSIQQYREQGIEAIWVQRGDLYVILRAEDRKVLKGINFRKVDLTELV